MFTNRLRNLARLFGHEGAEKLGARCARGGSARAISEPGGTRAQMSRAGQWHSSAYRLDLDLGAGEAAAMSRILIEAPGDKGAERGGPRGDPIP